MAQTKHFTAKRTLKLDCGHVVQTGESFQVTSVYSCEHEGNWPLKVLLACLTAPKQEPQAPPAKEAPPTQPPPQAAT